MLNREGGGILLGLNNFGTVSSVVEAQVLAMITNLVNLSNNQEKFDPPFILFPQSYQIRGNWVILSQSAQPLEPLPLLSR